MHENPEGVPAGAQPPTPAPTPTRVDTPAQPQASAPPALPAAMHPGPESPAQPQAQLPAQSQAPQPQAAPSAYAYPAPQPAAGYGPPTGPVPAQPNPYGQPAAWPPPAAQPGTGAAGRAVLFTVLGALVASAAWAGGVFLLGWGGGGPEADLRGYEAKANLCSSVDYSNMKTEYPEEDTAPVHNGFKHEALDESYCSISLKKSSTSSYSDAYFSVTMDLHKKTDPAAEFTAMWSEYDQRYEDYDVEKITGFGDEAYLVTEDTTAGDDKSGSRAVILAVRDGWMTYQMSWSAYGTSYDDYEMPDVDDVVQWVRDDTESTLENLASN
ncbi:hypothetical protein SGFS_005140 [Streptomyces graminofaciens]|uniref:Uncharacterized protein n=1 Tax=Streptomyces graminofaciens TaxID=68212 RepID=A0ABM7F0J2_9ACTN|nr:hypothetical protein [Streptomyces graminofaciens]BBC29223.1 hypothetical protein SGFS_005140 [Streptomyces graminofaciens]